MPVLPPTICRDGFAGPTAFARGVERLLAVSPRATVLALGDRRYCITPRIAAERAWYGRNRRASWPERGCRECRDGDASMICAVCGRDDRSLDVPFVYVATRRR